MCKFNQPHKRFSTVFFLLGCKFRIFLTNAISPQTTLRKSKITYLTHHETEMVYLVVTSKPQEADQSSVAYLQKLASYRNPQPETKACV